MPNYNMGYRYNVGGSDGGIFYNTDYRIIINIKEVINISENIGKILAVYVLNDKPIRMYDTIIQASVHGVYDSVQIDDFSDYRTFFSLTDKFCTTDSVSSLLVLATLYDRREIIDEVRSINQVLVEEGFSADTDISIEAIIDVLDKNGMNDLIADLGILLGIYEATAITDRTPRSVISDFLIGSNINLDDAYDWFIPFNMKVDWDTTSIQVMPETSNTTIEMPGIDGSIIEDTVYKDRLFQIVAFSEDDLSKAEKEELKTKITEILDSTKHQTKSLTVQSTDTSFDVKYDGQAVIAEGPSYVKATVPLRVSPYGHKTFGGELWGSGLVYNEGDAPVGAKHTISGPISDPSFTFGDHEYKWVGYVPENYNLVIDQQMMTCYLQDEFGVKKNAMSSLVGTFQKIPAHYSIALTVNGIPEEQIYTTWRDVVLW